MKQRILWLRISCWTGAIADGVATIRMLFPKPAYGAEYRYALGLGASLMLGWTFLLIWADRRPLERKGVILLTAFPVVTGLLVATVYSAISGLVDTIAVLTSLALQFGVPIAQLSRKFAHTRFEPSGHTTNPEIGSTDSITDYVFTWLGLRFSEDFRNERAAKPDGVSL